MMNIVYATSDLYSHPALISIKTLLDNNTSADEINIYYIGNGLSQENKDLLSGLVSEYGRIIIFIDMPPFLSEIGGLLRTNPIVYSYCYLQDILPADVDKVILLESDAIVTANIEEFMSLPIDGYYLAAADDFQSKWYKRKLNMHDGSVYFNSGVMLINLKKWREDNITEKITAILKQGTNKMFYEVQDELNVLFENQILVLPPRFNCTTSVFVFNYKNMLRYRKPSTVCTEDEFLEGKEKPLIVHFTKNHIIQARPWIEKCGHEYAEYYMRAKKETVLKDEPLWEDDRGFVSKTVYRLYSMGMKSILASVLGIVHARLYPSFLYKIHK